jgi:hypothetical protein
VRLAERGQSSGDKLVVMARRDDRVVAACRCRRTAAAVVTVTVTTVTSVTADALNLICFTGDAQELVGQGVKTTFSQPSFLFLNMS